MDVYDGYGDDDDTNNYILFQLMIFYLLSVRSFNNLRTQVNVFFKRTIQKVLNTEQKFQETLKIKLREAEFV